MARNGVNNGKSKRAREQREVEECTVYVRTWGRWGGNMRESTEAQVLREHVRKLMVKCVESKIWCERAQLRWHVHSSRITEINGEAAKRHHYASDSAIEMRIHHWGPRRLIISQEFQRVQNWKTRVSTLIGRHWGNILKRSSPLSVFNCHSFWPFSSALNRSMHSLLDDLKFKDTSMK